MQVHAKSTARALPVEEHGHDRTVHVEHGVARELLLIALVVAMGVLAAVALLLPAMVTG